MGRGKGKTINVGDVKDMPQNELRAVLNAVTLGRIQVKGTALVRDRHGNARYQEPDRAGQYGEDNV